MRALVSAFVTAGTLVAFASPAVAATCENLSDLTIAKGAVTLAHSVAPGAFAPPPGRSGGPPGTSTFDMVAAVDAWRDGGRPPDRINASRVREGRSDRTRPLCAWPAVARYKGSGSIDDASNFVCR